MENKSIYELLEAVFEALLPEYTGREKSLELYLINAPNNKIIELAKQLNIN